VIDLIVLSLGLLLHMWALPYSFKNFLIDTIVRVAQLGFGIIVMIRANAAAFLPTPLGLIAGAGVGLACFVFQLFWNRDNPPGERNPPAAIIGSQAVILLFHVPTEEIFYRGVFFASLTVIWGPFTALVLSTALSTMVTVVSSRKQLYWLGSGILGVLCCLGYYWSQSIWAPVLIHALNDIAFIARNEKRNIFES
jgi:membrane protease YdiL (CAAX protease family)